MYVCGGGGRARKVYSVPEKYTECPRKYMRTRGFTEEYAVGGEGRKV
jgi:hypothetical protein